MANIADSSRTKESMTKLQFRSKSALLTPNSNFSQVAYDRKDLPAREKRLAAADAAPQANIAVDSKIQTENRRVIKSHAKMFLWGIVVTLFAVLVASVLLKFYPSAKALTDIFEFLGYICWSTTLGTLGWEIQTNTGNTPPEKLNKQLAFFFSILGIFCFVMAHQLYRG